MQEHLLPINSVQFPVDFADKQLEIFWLHSEIKVHKDVQDILVNLTEQEKHGVQETLRLFTLYETSAGSEYWGGRFRDIFKKYGDSFERMASVFSMFELAVHAPFYKKINEALHKNTPDFYLSYKEEPELLQRMEDIAKIIDSESDLLSLAGFSMIEGVILYSNFAFLKHFQNQGKNKIPNIVRGINMSVRDEAMHSLAGSVCFKYLLDKLKISSEDLVKLECNIQNLANILYINEKDIISRIFSKGKIQGITQVQLEHFVQSRINVCLEQLGFSKLFVVAYNPIADWFYDSTNQLQFNDFFVGQGREYVRNWSEEDLQWIDSE